MKLPEELQLERFTYKSICDINYLLTHNGCNLLNRFENASLNCHNGKFFAYLI